MKAAVLFLALASVVFAAPRRHAGVHSTQAKKAASALPEMTVLEFAERIGLTVLVDLVRKAGLTEVLGGKGPFTVFGPINQAFQRLPPDVTQNTTLVKGLLMYHVISGNVYSSQLKDNLLAQSLLSGYTIRINLYQHEDETVATAEGARIILADRNASNGVLHIVNRILVPPISGAIVGVLTAGASRGQHTESFTTLVQAATAAGLTETLAEPGPFTLFAPTNDAFAKIPNKTLDNLLHNKTVLTKILQYHVVSGAQWAAGLYNGEVVKTVEGSTLTLHVERGPGQHNHAEVDISYGTRSRARVVRPDIAATNGVVHAIDSVLLPHDL